MKHLVLFFVMLLFSQISLSQDKKFSMEANLFRVVEDDGINQSGGYINKAFFFNGINIGYQISKKFRSYAEVNYHSNDESEGYGFSGRFYNKKELETRIGVDFIFNPKDKFEIVVGTQFYYDQKSIDGSYFTDYGPQIAYPVSFEATDIGGAVTAGARHHVSNRFYVFAKSRLGVGNYDIEPVGNLERIINPDSGFAPSHEEPISALGLAFKF